MEGFTLSLALLDYVPVAAFGAAGLVAGQAMGSPVFTTGAALSFLAGLLKATWKLVLAVSGRDIRAMNRPFVPMQATGFLLMLTGAVIRLFRSGLSAAAVLLGLPQAIFFVLWLLFTALMVWYKKHRFERLNARTNWTAQIINTLAQGSFLLAVLFAAG